jgi:hypothetical protein
MSVQNSSIQNSSMDIDSEKKYVYTTTPEDSIKLYTYDTDNINDVQDLEYLNCIPIVKDYNNNIIKPDNLLMYDGGDRLLLSDANNYNAILNLNIQEGKVTGQQNVNQKFSNTRGNQEVIYQVNKFDYNTQNELKQYDKCAIGLNNNTVMRFDVNTGELCHSKAYIKNPWFTAMCTDTQGNVIIGTKGGEINVYPTLGKKSAKKFSGLGDKITHLDVSYDGDVLATTDRYFIYFPNFVKKGSKDIIYFKGYLDAKNLQKLKLDSTYKLLSAKFCLDDSVIAFSIDTYLFHWKIEDLINDKQKFKIFESESAIEFHKFKDIEFVMTNTNPIYFSM